MAKTNNTLLVLRELRKEEKIIIEALLRKCNLLDRYSHILFRNNVYSFLQQNIDVIQGSYFECFLNAVLESCVLGTPVIAFKAAGGTKKIIENDINGYIVEDESEFIQKINNLLFQEEWNPSNVKKKVVEKSNKDYILGQYEQLFITIANR